MSEIDNLINSDKLTLVDIWAEWCGPCRLMNPIVSEISNEMKESVEVVKVDADVNKELLAKYGVRGIPTFILFRNGEVLWRQSGAMPKAVLVENINRFTN